MLPILPATIDIIFKTADMMLIIIVTIHAHPLPFNRPHGIACVLSRLVGEFRSFRCLEDKVPTSCMKSKLI